MKKGIHPENYRLVVMKDMSTDYMILTKSASFKPALSSLKLLFLKATSCALTTRHKTDKEDDSIRLLDLGYQFSRQ